MGKGKGAANLGTPRVAHQAGTPRTFQSMRQLCRYEGGKFMNFGGEFLFYYDIDFLLFFFFLFFFFFFFFVSVFFFLFPSP